MNREELDNIIDDAKNGKFVSKNGAFLEFLRVLANDEKIGSMAAAVGAYTKALPDTKRFIVARLPAIILNYYIVYKANVKTTILDDWLQNNNLWAEDIKNSAINAESLVLTVGRMLNSISSHTIG